MAETATLIPHKFNGMEISQRHMDGYLNATAACKACGKQLGHYLANQSTQDFLTELSRSIGIPIDLLVSVINTGRNEFRGTWVHPHVAINLAQWLSPEFAVQVSCWVADWMMTGQPPVQQESLHLQLLRKQIETMELRQELLLRTVQDLQQAVERGVQVALPDDVQTRLTHLEDAFDTLAPPETRGLPLRVLTYSSGVLVRVFFLNNTLLLRAMDVLSIVSGTYSIGNYAKYLEDHGFDRGLEFTIYALRDFASAYGVSLAVIRQAAQWPSEAGHTTAFLTEWGMKRLRPFSLEFAKWYTENVLPLAPMLRRFAHIPHVKER